MGDGKAIKMEVCGMNDGMLSIIVRVMELQGRGAVSAGWIPGCCAQCFLTSLEFIFELTNYKVIV